VETSLSESQPQKGNVTNFTSRRSWKSGSIKAWRELNQKTLDIEIPAKVRHCANTGLVPGTEKFREQVKKLRT
jgi:hypothetical protein